MDRVLTATKQFRRLTGRLQLVALPRLSFAEAIFPGPVIYTAAASGDGFTPCPAGAQGQVPNPYKTPQRTSYLAAISGFMGQAPVSRSSPLH